MAAEQIILGTYGASHLGDAICVSPLLRQLRQELGQQIFVTNHSSMVAAHANNPFLEGFRAGSNVQPASKLKGNGHLIQRLQAGFGVAVSAVPKPEIYLSGEETVWAQRERQTWPSGRPVCLLSCRAMADAVALQNVCWKEFGSALKDHFTIVQPVLTAPQVYHTEICSSPSTSTQTSWASEPIIDDAIVYENLPVRRFLALFSVVDAYCGPPSGGSHAAAAFDVNSLIVLWRPYSRNLQFPDAGRTVTVASFIYPQHRFICADYLRHRIVNKGIVEAAVESLLHRREVSVQHVLPSFESVPQIARRHFHSSRGRIISLPSV